jgi:hypothetical protein
MDKVMDKPTKTPLEEMIETAQEELRGSRRNLNAHMQAITNGYTIAMEVCKNLSANSSKEVSDSIISIARDVSKAMMEDFDKELSNDKST